VWAELIRIRIGAIGGGEGGFCEHSNEPSDSIKGREFLDQLSDC